MKKMMLWLCLMMIVPTLASADMVSISELRQQVEAICAETGLLHVLK